MSPLHSQTSMPQRGLQRWWVRKGCGDIVTRRSGIVTRRGVLVMSPRRHDNTTTTCPLSASVRRSRIPGCNFAVPRRPVNATEPRRRCHGRVAKALTRWPSLSMPAERGWRKHWTKQKYRHDLLKKIQQNMFYLIPPWTERPQFHRRLFQMNSREWRVSYFDLSTDVYS